MKNIIYKDEKIDILENKYFLKKKKQKLWN